MATIAPTSKSGNRAASGVQSDMLHAVIASIAALINTSSLDVGAPEALRMIGEQLDVDRCIVIENADRPGAPPEMIPTYQWNKPGLEPLSRPFVAEQIQKPDVLSWAAPLSEGKAVITTLASANAVAKDILRALKSTSILQIPIFVAGRYWGHIGLADGTPDRQWPTAELEPLFALATLFGATIERGRQIERLADADAIIRSSQTILYRQSPEPGMPFIYISSNVDQFGYDPAKLLADPLFYCTLIHPEDRARVACNQAQALRSKTPSVFEARFLTADGTYRWYEIRRRSIVGQDGKLKWFADEFVDIQERKLASQVLAYRERLLNAVMVGTAELVAGDSIAVGMAKALRLVGETLNVDRVLVLEQDTEGTHPPFLRHAWESPGVPVHVDQALLEAGGPEETAVQDRWLAPLRARKPVISYLQSSEGQVRRILDRMQNISMLLVPIFSGSDFWGTIGIDECKSEREWTTTEIETLQTFAQVIGILIVRDDAGLSLLKSEQRFRAVSETAREMVIMIDAAGHIEYWNPAAERTLGYTAAEAIGQPVHDWLAPERFREKAAAGMRKFIATGEGEALGKMLELAALRKDGAEIPVELSLSAMQIGSGRHAVAIIRDITERKLAEETLRFSEEQFRTIFESVNDAIIVHEIGAFVVIDANQRAYELYGYTVDEFRQFGLGIILSDKSQAAMDKAVRFAQLAASGQPQVFEWPAIRKDGRKIWVEVALRHATFGGRDLLLSVARDITERKTAEITLRQERDFTAALIDGLPGVFVVPSPAIDKARADVCPPSNVRNDRAWLLDLRENPRTLRTMKSVSGNGVRRWGFVGTSFAEPIWASGHSAVSKRPDTLIAVEPMLISRSTFDSNGPSAHAGDTYSIARASRLRRPRTAARRDIPARAASRS